MNKQERGLKPFISLILSTNIPKVALIIGLTASPDNYLQVLLYHYSQRI